MRSPASTQLLASLLAASLVGTAAPASAAPTASPNGQIALSTSSDPGFGSTPDARRRIAAPRFDAAESVTALKAKYRKSFRKRASLGAPGSSSHLPADAPFLLHRRRRLNDEQQQQQQQQQQQEKRLLNTVGSLLGGTTDLLGGVVGVLGTILFDGQFGIAVASTSNEQSDNEWLTTFGVGTPSQELQIVLDTGSSDTWVYSPACCYASNHDFFKPALSSTYSNRTVVNGKAVRARPGQPGQPWSLTYGSGYSTSSGYVGIDNVTLGDTSNLGSPPLQAAEVPIALITSITGQSRAGRGMEGLVGLAPSVLSDTEGGWTTPMEKLILDGKVAAPYLSATLGRADRTTGKGGGGRYLIGAIDNAAIRSGESVAWVDTTSQYYWGTSYDGMRMGSTDIVPSTTVRRVILDTGSALLNLPAAIAANANTLIKGAWYDNNSGVWVVPCRTGDPTYEASLDPAVRTPAYWLDIAGSSFGVPSLDLVFSPTTPLFPANATSAVDYCYSAIQVGPDAVSIVGGSFFKNHMVTFDWGPAPFRTRRMGFANRTDSPI
ncbi:hypothetical protein OC834_007701 [Tilletia horrida]|nr:hypothetical protein OC834_007701 [Tilletia horrida]